MKLRKDEIIVTAFAESASGPGWANRPIRVIVLAADKSLRQEWIQPEDQTAEMTTLYGASQAAHLAMSQAVKSQTR